MGLEELEQDMILPGIPRLEPGPQELGWMMMPSTRLPTAFVVARLRKFGGMDVEGGIVAQRQSCRRRRIWRQTLDLEVFCRGPFGSWGSLLVIDCRPCRRGEALNASAPDACLSDCQ